MERRARGCTVPAREDAQFLRARIAVCEEALRRFPDENGLMVENRRRAVAESYFELGGTDKAEALFVLSIGLTPIQAGGRAGSAGPTFTSSPTTGRRTTAGPRSCSAAVTRRPASGTGRTSPTGCCIERPGVIRRLRRSQLTLSDVAVRTPA